MKKFFTALFVALFAVSLSSLPSLAATTDFISTWKTDNTSSGSSDDHSVQLPLVNAGTYNFTVNWGDNSTSSITSYNDANALHTYASVGTYTLTIAGTFEGFEFRDAGDKLKLINVSQWGNMKLGDTGYYFMGATNFNATATDAPDLSQTTSLVSAFHGATSFNANINNWDISHVTNLGSTFESATSFNQPLNSWNVSNVWSLRAVFYGATSFNQPLNNWNVSKVTHFGIAFAYARSFNQDLSSWDIATGGVTAQSVTQLDGFLSGTSMSPQNYGKLLISWDALTDPTTGTEMFVNAQGNHAPNQFDIRANYLSQPVVLAARAALVARGWRITDSGPIGFVGASTQVHAAYTNSTQGNKTFAAIELAGRNSKDFTVVSSTCLSGAIAANSSCDVTLAWTPLGEGNGNAEVRLLPDSSTPNTYSSIGINYSSTGSCATDGFAGGDGSLGNPYQIATTEQFNCINAFDGNYLYLDKNFKLTHDLDFGGDPNAFQEVGTWNDGFNGTLDGDNHTISGIIDASTYSALVPWITGTGIVRNLILEAPQFVSDFDSGAVTTYGDTAAVIENVRVNGGLVKSRFGGVVGAMAGYADHISILKSSSSATVRIDSQNTGVKMLGGLVGQAVNGTTIRKSFSTGQITYVAGASDSDALVGGLAGQLGSQSEISDSYSISPISVTAQSTTTFVGGLVGESDSSSISRAIALSRIASPTKSGVAGKYTNTSIVADSFWNSEVTASSDATDSPIAQGGRTTAQLKAASNYSTWTNIGEGNPSSLDWTLVAEAYPQLSFEISRLNQNSAPSQSPSASPSASPTASPSASPSVSQSPSSSNSPAPVSTPTPSETPTSSPTTTPSVTPQPTPTPTVVVVPKSINIGVLSVSQIRKLNASEIATLQPAQLAKISAKQIIALTSKQLVAIKPKAIAAIKPRVFASLSSKALTSLTPAQRKAVTNKQAVALSPAQRKAIGKN